MKNKIVVCTGICLALLFAVVLMNMSGIMMTAKAESVETEIPTVEVNGENAEVRGLFTNISITLKGGNGVVTAVARNDFTLFPSTIPAYVELYSSSTYKEYVSDMVLEGSSYSSDLNIYESIEFSASTNGVNKYWQARVRYKFDNDAWTDKVTGSYLFDAQGNLVK